MKVLIVEKNSKPGGYCTSFEREGFRFDAAVHCLGGLGGEGKLSSIWHELELHNYIKLIRSSPLDIFWIQKYRLEIWEDIKRDMEEFIRIFPHEKINIKNFFSFIKEASFTKIYFSCRGKTFKYLLDKYFKDEKIKAILSLPLGNVGLPSNMLSAIAGICMYKYFLLDGGYCPVDGMEVIPNTLAEIFNKIGGKIFYSSPVIRIDVESDKIKSVDTSYDSFFSKAVVSAMDMRTLFFDLIEKNSITPSFLFKLKRMLSTNSCFLVYLGVENLYDYKDGVNIWFNDNYNVDKVYKTAFYKKPLLRNKFIFLRLNPLLTNTNRRTVALLINSSYVSANFWRANKTKIMKNLIKRALYVLPELRDKIRYFEAATPLTLEKFTGNFRGAMYGWAPTCEQVEHANLYKLPFRNLFICGHWSEESFGYGGLMKAIFTGKLCAMKIFNFNKIN